MTPKHPVNVLFVDDQTSNLDGFRANFRRNYTVFTAASAEEARKILSDHEIHVLVTDQKMPHTLGTELIEEVLEKHPHQTRILLTAYTDSEVLLDAFQKGLIFQYVFKPYVPEDLKELIDKAYDLYSLKKIKEQLYKEYVKSQEEILIMQIKNQL